MYSNCELFLTFAFLVIIQHSGCWRFCCLINIFSFIYTFKDIIFETAAYDCLFKLKKLAFIPLKAFVYLVFFSPKTRKIIIWEPNLLSPSWWLSSYAYGANILKLGFIQHSNNCIVVLLLLLKRISMGPILRLHSNLETHL